MFQALTLSSFPSLAITPALESRAWLLASLAGLGVAAGVVLHALSAAFGG